MMLLLIGKKEMAILDQLNRLIHFILDPSTFFILVYHRYILLGCRCCVGGATHYASATTSLLLQQNTALKQIWVLYKSVECQDLGYS